MGEMIERVAKAIVNTAYGCTNHHEDLDAWLPVARAAIDAMREPTSDMEEAALDGDFDIYWGYAADGRPTDPSDVWHAMIDAALTEPDNE